MLREWGCGAKALGGKSERLKHRSLLLSELSPPEGWKHMHNFRGTGWHSMSPVLFFLFIRN